MGIHAVDRIAFRRAPRQPVEAGGLRIIVRKAGDRIPVAGEIAGDIGGERGFAAAALGVDHHDAAHGPSSDVSLLVIFTPSADFSIDAGNRRGAPNQRQDL